MSPPKLPVSLQAFADDDAVLICIDLETHCHNSTFAEYKRNGPTNKRRVCEIGICILDTRNLFKVHDFGDRGINLSPYFEAYDFGIRDSRHEPGAKCHKGYKCKTGRPEDFLFGQPEYIWKSEIGKTVEGLVRDKVDMPSPRCTSTLSRDSSVAASCGNEKHGRLGRCCEEARLGSSGYRKAIFLYFSMANDRIWLKENGVDLEKSFPNSETIDIQQLWPSTTIAEQLGHSLLGAGDLYLRLGIPSANKHNGGNDAFFELQGYLAGLCLTQEQENTILDEGYLDDLPIMWQDWEKRKQDARRAIGPVLEMNDIQSFPGLGDGRKASSVGSTLVGLPSMEEVEHNADQPKVPEVVRMEPGRPVQGIKGRKKQKWQKVQL